MSRTIRALGATATLAALILAGCSSNDGATTTSPSVTTEAGGGQSTDDATPTDDASPTEEADGEPPSDLAAVLEGLTYDGAPLKVRDPQKSIDMIKQFGDFATGQGAQNIKPEACNAVVSKGSSTVFDLDKVTVDDFAMAAPEQPSVTVQVIKEQVANFDIALSKEMLSACKTSSMESEFGTIEMTMAEHPLSVPAREAIAYQQDVTMGDTKSGSYTATAKKSGVVVAVNLTDPTAETIDKANGLLTTVLDRL